jgi:hypothetical protein
MSSSIRRKGDTCARIRGEKSRNCGPNNEGWGGRRRMDGMGKSDKRNRAWEPLRAH